MKEKNSYRVHITGGYGNKKKKVVRGTIYDVKGRPLAKTQFEGETKERIYLGGEAFGPVIGYQTED